MAPTEFTAARNALGLSQERIATKLGVGRATIDRWENGRTRIPEHMSLALATLRRNAMVESLNANCPAEWESKARRVEIQVGGAGSFAGWELTEDIEGYCRAGQIWLDGEEESTQAAPSWEISAA